MGFIIHKDVRASLKRIKTQLSKTLSNEIFRKYSLSYPALPKGMAEKEFTSLKINWLLENNRSDLVELKTK